VNSINGVWGRVSPPTSGVRVWVYNLKLISTLHNDSIPETPSGKSGVDVSTPVHPVAMPLRSSISGVSVWKTEDRVKLTQVVFILHPVPAYPVYPEKEAAKRKAVCLSVCLSVCLFYMCVLFVCSAPTALASQLLQSATVSSSCFSNMQLSCRYLKTHYFQQATVPLALTQTLTLPVGELQSTR